MSLSDWLEKAKAFLDEAEGCLRRGLYWLACFHAQQSAELYLKAVLLNRAGSYPFTHDLTVLLDDAKALGVDVPGDLYACADALTPHYTLARYPGRKPVEYGEAIARRCLEYAKRIAGWAIEALKGQAGEA